MTPQGYADGGFVGAYGPPTVDNPSDWIVWHFTHVDNLRGIVQAGGLLADSAVTSFLNVASSEIKTLRRSRPVVPVDGPYPSGLMVSNHVPWYVAAKSPMLFCVCRGYNVDYNGGAAPLIFFGVKIGDLAQSGAIWCFSDRNASVSFATFSVALERMGEIVDFELLKQKSWANTSDDQDRKARRAAEVLVADHVPLELVSVVLAFDAEHLELARAAMNDVRGSREYVVRPEFYY